MLNTTSRFFEDYHHFLPFLEPLRNPDEYYDSSPLLFWSIVAVAARQYRADATLLTRLSPVLTDLLWTVIASGNISTAHVQALLLLAYWQLPNIHLWTDRSLILTNIALTSAMHLGMHRPGREDEYTKFKVDTRRAGLLERTRTWAACVCLSLRCDMLPLKITGSKTLNSTNYSHSVSLRISGTHRQSLSWIRPYNEHVKRTSGFRFRLNYVLIS